MEEKKTVFDFIGDLFATYGIIVVIFVVLNMVIGDAASVFSSLFEYGSLAFSTDTLLQLLALALIICMSRNILLTDRWIGQMSMIVRNAVFFLVITVAIVLFVIMFKWFPITDIKAWIGFLVSFALCSSLAVVISVLRENAENRKMIRAL